MSHQLVSRSSDLLRLRSEGYDVDVHDNYLVVRNVPYVNSSREVVYGTLISELTTTGSKTARPQTHVALFAGGIPCDDSGGHLDRIIIAKEAVPVGSGLTAACTFSSKPSAGYVDYHHKMTAYIAMVTGWAQAIEPHATAKTYPPALIDADESVFRYLDSASGRAGISHLTAKLALPKVAIVGLGGTGSYILDLLAKTPVGEIHLYDADRFYAHNAFRSPGAPTAEELDGAPLKVVHLQRRYDAMHRGIVAHPIYVVGANVDELSDMSFVFLAIDSGPAKRTIVEALERHDVSFIETGLGADEHDGALAGLVRITASLPGHRRHVWEQDRIDFSEPPPDAYDRNVQIADLNALNAIMAVIKWKKLCGFYADYQDELTSAYVIGRNRVVNVDAAA